MQFLKTPALLFWNVLVLLVLYPVKWLRSFFGSDRPSVKVMR